SPAASALGGTWIKPLHCVCRNTMDFSKLASASLLSDCAGGAPASATAVVSRTAASECAEFLMNVAFMGVPLVHGFNTCGNGYPGRRTDGTDQSQTVAL